MAQSITSEASIEIHAPQEKVWEALTDPAIVKQWFFGTELITTWEQNSPIVFRGEWQGKPYEDKGTVVAIKPGEMFEYTHLSSRTALTDTPENYERIGFYLSASPDGITLTIKESNLPSVAARDKSLQLWGTVLANLKQLVEQPAG